MTTYTGAVDQNTQWNWALIPVNYSDTVTLSVGGSNVEDLEFLDVYVTQAWLNAHTPLTVYNLPAAAYFDFEGNGSSPTSVPLHTVGTLSAANGGNGGNPSGFLDANGSYVHSGSGYLLIEVYGYADPLTQNFTLTTQFGGGQSPPPPPPPPPPSPPPGTYIGPNGGDFGNPANWSGGVVPGSNTNANIGSGITVNSSGTYEVSSLGLNTNSTFNVNSGGFVADNYIINQGTINDSGSLQANPFRSGAYIINYGTIIITIPIASLTAPTGTNYGNMVAHGGLIDFDPLTNSGTMSVDSGGEISVTGSTVNNGSITANSGGTVYLGGQVSATVGFVTGGSSGPLNINGGSLVVGGGVSEPVYFQSGGQLTIDQPAAFGSTIVFAGNPANDVIDLPGTTVTHVYNTGSSLILTESNGAAVALSILNLGFNYVTAAADGAGGSALFFTPGAPTDMLLRNASGAFEIYDLGANTIQGAAALGQVGLEWQVAGYGDFSGNPGEADMLMRNSKTGALEYYDLSNNRITAAGGMGQVGLEWSVAGFGDFSGNANETDMLMRNSKTGAFEIYDIRGNSIVGAGGMGQVGLEWSVAGFGDFSGNANETDMLMRSSKTGAFELYDIRGNTIVGAAPMGQVGLEWSVAGFGDFSGNANETDMLMRNSNTGAFEIYDITNNRITSAASMGQVGLEWQVVGFGAFGLNPGEGDMLMRSTKTGALEVYDIYNNTIKSAASMGQVGLEWQNSGIAAPPPNGTGAAPAQLAQSMASFAPAGGALGSASLPDPALMGTATVGPLAAPVGEIPRA